MLLLIVSVRRLLIRPGAIGDFILSLPALEHLKASYTEVWCAAQNVPLARFADRALSITSAGLDRIGFLPDAHVFERLRAFDEIHSWYGAARPEFQQAVTRLPFRFYPALPVDAGLHATDFYCAQVGAAPSLPRIPLEPAERRDFAILHPFASSSAKRWPVGNFHQLEGLLAPCVPVRWCAGPEEALPNAVRIPDLLELARWIASARIYIGNDSGISHLAAAVGTPLVALFGPSDPAVWAPRGACIRTLHRTPLAAIDADQVFAIAKTLL